jgi:cell division protein FtsQ
VPVTAVTAPRARIDPRVRARRVAVRRAEGRRRVRRLLVGVAVLSVATAGVGALFSPLLAVHQIVVRGAGTDSAAVRRAAGVATGAPMVFVDTGAAAAEVRHVPWVASARVSREFPTTLTITVTARVPVAWVSIGPGQVSVIDGHGVVTAHATSPPPGLPQLAGVSRVATLGGRITPAGPAVAAAALGAALRGRVTTVSLGPDGLNVAVLGGPQLRFGDTTALTAKAEAAAAVLGALVHPATYLDVSVPAAPVAG